jgi:hypothetical protein
MTDNSLVEGEGVNAGSGRALRDDHDEPRRDVRSGGDPSAVETDAAPAEDLEPAGGGRPGSEGTDEYPGEPEDPPGQDAGSIE